MRQYQLLMHLQRLLDGELTEDAMDDPGDMETLLDDLDEMDTGLAGHGARRGRRGDGTALLEILKRIGARRAGRGAGAARGGPLMQILQALDGRPAGNGRARGGGIARLLRQPVEGEAETPDGDPVAARRRRQILELRTAWLEALGESRRRRTAAPGNSEGNEPQAG